MPISKSLRSPEIKRYACGSHSVVAMSVALRATTRINTSRFWPGTSVMGKVASVATTGFCAMGTLRPEVIVCQSAPLCR